MSNISIIPSITCKVECGTERGTAFFVDANQLLTAYHVVGSALNGNLIYVEIEQIAYECELTIVEHNKDIALLKLKDETVTHKYGSLLSMPIEAKTHFRFWGYPNTLIGEAVGQSVKIRVDETYVALLRDFDAYAVFEDEKHLTEYAGFSGSPVYADSDKIIGIVTNILDSHIGFISIKSVEEKLKALSVTIDSDYVKFQEVSYGRKESIKKLHEQIKLAGNRYKPNLNVPNQSLTTLFANLWDIQALKKHKEILHKSKQVFLNLQRSNPRLFDTPADGTLSDLDYNIGMQRDVWRLKNRSDTSDWKTVEVALKEESLSWEQINVSAHSGHSEYVGCLFAEPATAKRDIAITNECKTDWFKEQYDILCQQGLTENDKLYLPYVVGQYGIDMTEIMQVRVISSSLRLQTLSLHNLLLLLKRYNWKLILPLSSWSDNRLENYLDYSSTMQMLTSEEVLFIVEKNSGFLSVIDPDSAYQFNIMRCINVVARKYNLKISTTIQADKAISRLGGNIKVLVLTVLP